ncbi:MAG: hypothetical protein HYS17_01100 [Micavibrio aeruginosavorus]|uniref:Uncharacterized protein n=1 Tax=Micavibrio aeruginosavorus TaxID=349221 RepID=A0A7T5UGZ6_9BACT|nr:MAG: hypothetical protein HYS17_01100 [Micavibrio aeruginosavorus]
MKTCFSLPVYAAFLIVVLSSPVFAASDTEFGERFTNQTPAALAEDETGEDVFAADVLNRIAPAAGGADSLVTGKDQDTHTGSAETGVKSDPREKMGFEWYPAEQQD